MASDLPYMTTVKNLGAILDKIQGAGTPPKFTRDFLVTTLGFKGSGDRGVIQVLKQLGLLTPDGLPTDRYNDFRRTDRSGSVLAQGLRDGWAPVFMADETAHSLSTTSLIEIFKNVTGKGEAVAQKLATTFRALADRADWESAPSPTPAQSVAESDSELDSITEAMATSKANLNLHTDVHIHLPSSVDAAVYTAIFRAIRDELL